jgi:hypothetical protein
MVLPQEFSAGHVKGALNLDSTAFSDNSLVDNLVEQLQAKSQVGTARHQAPTALSQSWVSSATTPSSNPATPHLLATFSY